MRWALVPLLAALFLLTGCHELWGGSSSSQSSATVTYSSAGSASEALSNLRASIPAVGA
jgi:ABC-type molybdate transport system substrate-binding protein